MTITGSSIDNNLASADGGGADIIGGATISNTDLSGNSATNEGGGLAFFNFQSEPLILIDSTISGNSASNGGGLYLYGNAQITNSTLSGNNAAGGVGGGLNLACGSGNSLFTLNLVNSTVSGNTARIGGGLYLYGTVSITNTRITANYAVSGYGGGVYLSSDNLTSTLTIANSTIDNNSASAGENPQQDSDFERIEGGEGGGLYLDGDAQIINSTITENGAFGGTFQDPQATDGSQSIPVIGEGGGIYDTGFGTVTLINDTLADDIASGSPLASFQPGPPGGSADQWHRRGFGH